MFWTLTGTRPSIKEQSRRTRLSFSGLVFPRLPVDSVPLGSTFSPLAVANLWLVWALLL